MKVWLKLVFSLVLVGSLALISQATVWTIDQDHSNVGFKIQHLMVSSVKGTLPKLSGVIKANDKNLTLSQVTVSIDATAINTNQAQRDEHLKSADFLDVAKYPTISFISKKLVRSGKGYKVKGDLTLHGVTKSVILSTDQPSKESKDPWGNIRRGISATTKVSRKDFGIIWNKPLETGGVLLGDIIEISLDIEVVKAK